MKVRIWTGRETLAAINGAKVAGSFEAFSTWLHKQPAGNVEVWAGRWWAVTKEAVHFRWDGTACLCKHPIYQSKKGLSASDYSGFFEYEAWKRAKQSHDFFFGINDLSEKIISDIKR